jgi:hypothetical protein
MGRLRAARLAACILGGACAPAFAQEPALFEPTQQLDAAESLGENLLVTEAAPAGVESGAEAVGEPVSVQTRGDAGRGPRWRFAPHLEVTGVFDDNIFIQPDNEVSDFLLTIAPGLAFGYWDDEEERERYLARMYGSATLPPGKGNFLMMDYTAYLLGFARTSSQNSFDHDGRIAGQWQFGKLTLGASFHGDARSETANADVGGRVRRTTLRTAIQAGYQLSDKTALEVTLFHTDNDPGNFSESKEWRGEAYLSYAPTPLVKFGVGASGGLVDVENGEERTFERLFVGSSYSLTEKLEASARVGVEFRQSDGPSGDAERPIFEADVTWTPAESTRVRLEGFRSVDTSALRPDADILRTGGAVRFQREIQAGLHFTIEGGYAVWEYVGLGANEERTDRFFYVSPGLLYNFAHWGNVRASYTHRSNDSNQSRASFDNNQITLQISLTF